MALIEPCGFKIQVSGFKFEKNEKKYIDYISWSASGVGERVSGDIETILPGC